jgi:cyclohexyl-isocyanide hydratase
MKHEDATLPRRALLQKTAYALTALTAAPLLARCSSDAANGGGATEPTSPTGGALGAPSDEPLQIGMLLFPKFTLLDLVGPHAALALHGEVHFVYRALEPVPSDSGVPLTATTTYDDCPLDLDVLFVPGGFVADAMGDPDVLKFLTDRAPRAKFVTSVCTGSLVLAAAGLLDGYRATSHWLSLEDLRMFDVDVVEERVVIDRNRMTGGGVTAGVDFGLVLLSQLRGEETGKRQQLMLEYAPQPPYDTGEPSLAGPELVMQVRTIMKPLGDKIRTATEEAVQRLKAG